MASMARSGETVLLRSLAAHPAIFVPGQIDKRDDPAGRALIEKVQREGVNELDREDPCVSDCGIAPTCEAIVVKQGVWEHRWPFDGFILVRNPASVYRSLTAFDRFRLSGDYLASQLKRLAAKTGLGRGTANVDNRARLRNWANDIDDDLADLVPRVDLTTAICAFYNRRMLALHETGLPVLHYERFVADPEASLRQVLARLGLPFDPAVLWAHEEYEAGQKGHGRADLSAPIHAGSMEKYREIGRRRFDRICALTLPTWQRFGYRMSWDAIDIDPAFQDGFGSGADDSYAGEPASAESASESTPSDTGTAALDLSASS
mgnify:CR=1 FL=1